jgi:phosphatidate phosphatase APP1
MLMASHEVHKVGHIERVLAYYAELPFVLIGDSGQHDPEIYLRVVKAHPGRIRAAFIRDVTPDVRDQAVARISEETAAAGSEMLYIRDSDEAMRHALRLGLISSTEEVRPK